MINLRLTSEYMAGPIFCSDPDAMGHVDVVDMPLSKRLKIKINAWNNKYQATFNSDYPPDSGFKTREERIQHELEGAFLAYEMQEELGKGYVVKFVA